MPVLLLNCEYQFQYCNKILHLKFYSFPLTSLLPLSPTYYIIPLFSSLTLFWHKTWNFPTFHFSILPPFFSEPLAVTCAIEQLSQSNKVLLTLPEQPEQFLKTSMPSTTASHTHAPTPHPHLIPSLDSTQYVYLNTGVFPLCLHCQFEINPASTSFPAREVFCSSFCLVFSPWVARLLLRNRRWTFYSQGHPVWECLVDPQHLSKWWLHQVLT